FWRLSSVAFEEGEHAAPCIRRGLGELLEAAVEEAVRGALVGHDLVRDAGLGQRPIELGVVLSADVPVVAGLEREDRRLELGRARNHVAGPSVEADRSR